MKIFLLITLLSACGMLTAQQNTGKKIVGVIYAKNQNVKAPLPRASVYIPGVASSTISDSKGYFSLDLSQCGNCKVGEPLKIYVNSEKGYTEQDYTIPINPDLKPVNIEIIENKILSLNGIVRDRKNGRLIKGIKVTVVIQNYGFPAPVTITDDNGTFQLIIRKDGIAYMQAIQMLFSDANNSRYKDMEKVVFINQYEPVKVEMEECTDCGYKYNLKIRTQTTSPIKVKPGDVIIIKASGIMKVGNIVGTSGPEGIPNNRGFANTSLAGYNYFPNWNHAVLLYRLGEKDSWKFYDDRKENIFIAQTSGNVQFAINDNTQNDNSGAYEVEVTVRK